MKVASFALLLLALIAVALAIPNLPRVAISSAAPPAQYRVVQPTMTFADKESPSKTLSRVLTEETQNGWTFVTVIQLPGSWTEVNLPVYFVFRKS
jgi:hypothetical protein